MGKTSPAPIRKPKSPCNRLGMLTPRSSGAHYSVFTSAFTWFACNKVRFIHNWNEIGLCIGVMYFSSNTAQCSMESRHFSWPSLSHKTLLRLRGDDGILLHSPSFTYIKIPISRSHPFSLHHSAHTSFKMTTLIPMLPPRIKLGKLTGSHWGYGLRQLVDQKKFTGAFFVHIPRSNQRTVCDMGGSSNSVNGSKPNWWGHGDKERNE